MGVTTIFDFSTPSNYTLDNVEVSALNAVLSLVDNPGQLFSQPLSSGSGFTFNPANTSIAAGILRQINQLVTPAFDDLINVTAGAGSLTAGAGSTVWNGSGLSVQSLTGTGFVKWVTTSNTNAQMVGLAQAIPSNPGANYQALNFAFYLVSGGITIYESGASKGNFGSYSVGDTLQIQVTGTTVTYLHNGTVIYTSLAVCPFPIYFGAAFNNVGDVVSSIQLQNSPTQYVGDTITFPTFTYSGLGSIISFDDLTDGGETNGPQYTLHGLYWNGVAWVASNGTYAQSNPIAVINANIESLPNNNVLTLRAITQSGSVQMQITAPVVVSYTGQIYPESGGTIQSNSGFTAQEVTSFAAALAESGSDTVTFALVVNGQLMYWNGTTWATSDGSLAETNTAATLLANVATLITVNSTVKVFALLVSANGMTTPSLTSMTVQYNFGAIEGTAPPTCIVYGFLRDIQSNPVVGAVVQFSLVDSVPNGYMEGSDHVLLASQVSATTDENGYFEVAVLVSQFQGSTTSIVMTITSPDGTVVENVGGNGQPLTVVVPNQQSVDVTTLVAA